MTFIAPGIDFLVRILTPLLTIFVVVVAYLKPFISDRVGYSVSVWILLSGFGFSLLLIAIIYVLSTRFLQRRQAFTAGARLAPEIKGILPGNFDFVVSMLRSLNEGYPGDGLVELLQNIGPVVNVRCLWEDVIFTASPNHIKTILATDFQNYVKGDDFKHTMKSVLGTGVFNSDGDMWKFHRSLTRPFFTKEKISHFELFDHRAQQAISKLKERVREGYAVDFQDLMSRFTLDAATDFLFGKCVESLSANLPYPHNAVVPSHLSPEASHEDAADDFAKAFRRAQELVSYRQYTGWIWPLTEFFEDKTAESMRIVNAFVEPIVKEALQRKQKVNEDNETLLDHLVKATDDPLVIKDEMLNIMIAGRDSTAATLTFVVYFLSLHPEILLRVRKEILDKVGASRRPDYDDIKDMKYLRAVINETLRLYPIVPFNIRQCVNATTWESETPDKPPYYIPAGTNVSYSVFIMHRRKDLWGPDAEEFDPDRFLDERYQKYLAKNPFLFLPFNAGPRICLGQQFAYNEVSFMLVRLLQSFSSFKLDLASSPPESLPPAEWANLTGRKATEKFFPKMHLTMYANGGLWVKFAETE